MLSWGRQVLRRVFIVLSALMLAAIFLRVVGGLLFPQTPIRVVHIKGDISISAEVIYRLLGLDSEQQLSYYNLDTKILERKLSQYVLVKDAGARKIYPDTLEITLRRRRPLAVILLDDEGSGQLPALIDQEGVLYRTGTLPPEALPFLSGLTLAANTGPSRLPKLMWPMLANLAQLRERAPDYFALISEIGIVFTDDGLTTDLSLTSYPTRVRGNGDLDPETIKTALVALEVLQRGQIFTPVIDMRTTGIVYLREGAT